MVEKYISTMCPIEALDIYMVMDVMWIKMKVEKLALSVVVTWLAGCGWAPVLIFFGLYGSIRWLFSSNRYSLGFMVGWSTSIGLGWVVDELITGISASLAASGVRAASHPCLAPPSLEQANLFAFRSRPIRMGTEKEREKTERIQLVPWNDWLYVKRYISVYLFLNYF